MKKDYLNRRSKDAEAPNEVSEVENGDPLSGSSDPFDVLLNSKPDQTPTKSNGKKAPSPIPEDSDAENDTAEKSTDEKSEVNGDSADSAGGNDTGDNGEEGYEVDDIVGHKFRANKKYFRIRWKNYDEKADTWELEDNLSCPEIIERYLEAHPDAKVIKEKKVRISLPPSRLTPKRTAAERKSVVDDGSDGEDSEKKKSPSKRGRPKKTKSGKAKATKEEVYEVEKIVDDEMRAGKKYYRIRWKGWGAKSDTWEPKSSLSCPDIIKKYESSKNDDESYEVEKIVGEKIEKGGRFFLVKWKGWPESSNTWENEKSVDCFELIEKFRDSCRSAGKSNNKRTASTPSKASKAKKSRKTVSDDEADDDDDDDDEDDDANDDADDDNENNDDDEKEWEVEKIVNMRKGKGGKKEFLIRWKGCKSSDDTWEPEGGISCPELISAFIKKNKK